MISTPTAAVGATFQTLPGASFVVNGAAQAHDAALDHGFRRNEMAERLVGRRHLRGRVLQRHQQLCRQGHRAICLVGMARAVEDFAGWLVGGHGRRTFWVQASAGFIRKLRRDQLLARSPNHRCRSCRKALTPRWAKCIHQSWDVAGQICDTDARGALFASLAGLRSVLPLITW